MIRDLIDKPEEPYSGLDLLGIAIAQMFGAIWMSALVTGVATLIIGGSLWVRSIEPYVTVGPTFLCAALSGAVITAPLPGLLIFVVTELPGRVSLRKPLVWIESRLGLPEWYPESWEPQGTVRLPDCGDAEAQQPAPKKFNRGFSVPNVALTALYVLGGALGNPPLGAYIFLKFGWMDGSMTVWHAFMCGVGNVALGGVVIGFMLSYNHAFRYCNGGRDLDPI